VTRAAGYYWIQDGAQPPEVAEWVVDDHIGDHWIGCGWGYPVMWGEEGYDAIRVLSRVLVAPFVNGTAVYCVEGE